MNTEERIRQMLDRARREDEVALPEWDRFVSDAHRSIRMQRAVATGTGTLMLMAVIAGSFMLFDDDASQPVRPIAPTAPIDGKTTVPSVPVAPRDSEIWLVDADQGVVARTVEAVPIPSTDDDMPLNDVVGELLEGPEPGTRPSNITTAIPEGTTLEEASVSDDVAIIDLSSEFLSQDVGEGTMQLRLAQVVFTATQFSYIDSVVVLVDGKPYLGMNEAVHRNDFHHVAPPIVVESPEMGTTVSQPLVVAGTADVFEGTVSIDLLATAHGKDKKDKIFSTFATAECGSGCRGKFHEEIILSDLAGPTHAVLHVYEESAEDGSRLHEVKIPITLLPAE